jgi:hypothetical protein
VFAAALGWLAAVLATQHQAAEDDALDAELAVRSPEPVPN